MLPLNILLAALSVALGVAAIGGDTWKKHDEYDEANQLTIRGWISIFILVLTLILGSTKELLAHREQESKDHKIDELSNQISDIQKVSLNFSQLRPLDIDDNLKKIIKKFGPPTIRKNLIDLYNDSDISALDMTYCRWSNDKIELQTITDTKGVVIAFVVRILSPSEAYTYTSSPINWILGHSSYKKISESPISQKIGPDAKFLSYIERNYFGRWGHYNSFFFAGPLFSSGNQYYSGPLPEGKLIDDFDLETLQRGNAIPNAIGISGENPIDDSESGVSTWEKFMEALVSIPASRFEGI